MRIPRTPPQLRHIPAVVAFWSIALATIDPRLGSPVLGIAAAAVGIGLLLKRPFARPMGAGLASSWLMFVAFAGQGGDFPRNDLPAWSSVAWASAGLATLALATLAFTPPRRAYAARGALACAALGLIAGVVEWTAYDELWVRPGHFVPLLVLAGAGLLAIKRPREAASLVVALGAAHALDVVEGFRGGLFVGPIVLLGWWFAEHALRAVEGRPFATGRFARAAEWVGAACFLGAGAALVVFVGRHHSFLHFGGFDFAFLGALVGLYAFVALGLARGWTWAGPLAVGIGVSVLLRGWWPGELSEAFLLLPLVALAPTMARLNARRGLALAGLGMALSGGLLYAFFRNSWGDPGNIVLAMAGLAAVVVAVVGVARGRTWGLLAAMAAIGLVYGSSQAVSGVSAFDVPTGCIVTTPFPGLLMLAGLYLCVAAYATPLLRALRR